MKKTFINIFILTFFIQLYSNAKSDFKIDIQETNALNHIFAGLMCLDNHDNYLAKQYLKEAVEYSKLTGNSKLTGYAHLARGIYFQEAFPFAKDIPARQREFSNAIDLLKNISQRENSDKLIEDIVFKLNEDWQYRIDIETVLEIYNSIKDEKQDDFSSLKMFLLKKFSKKQNLREVHQIINDYKVDIKPKPIVIARNYANAGLSYLPLITGESGKKYVKSTLENANYYYYASKTLTDKGKFTILSPESYVIESILDSKFPNEYLVDRNLSKNEYVNENGREGIIINCIPPSCPNTPWASIEIGSSGIKFSVICEKLDKNGDYTYRFINDIKKSNIDTKFSEFTELSTNVTLDAIDNFYKSAVKEFGLPNSQIFIIFSSGIGDIARRKDKMQEIENLRKKIASKYSKNENEIEVLTPAEEARLTLLGIVTSNIRPKLYTSGIIDIGTGNLKGGFCNNNNCDQINFKYFNSEWAIKNITSNVTQNPDLTTPEKAKQFAEEVKQYIQGGPLKEISNQFTQISIRNKTEIFLTGGIFWAITTLLYPQKTVTQDLSYININLNDVINFKEIAIKSYADYVNPKGYTDSEAEAIRDVTDKFNQVKAIVGAVLAEEILKDLQNSPVLKKYYYSKYSVVGWPTGYIIKQIDDK